MELIVKMQQTATINRMNTIEDVRKANFLAVRNTYDCKDFEFADLLDISASYYGQLKSGVRPIGNTVARKFEKRLQLDRGALDQAPDTSTEGLSTDEATIVKIFREIDSGRREILLAHARLMSNEVKLAQADTNSDPNADLNN